MPLKVLFLHHGVYSHILKHQLGPLFQRMVKGIVADDVPGQAGAAASR